jgi:hypothetical protein
LTCGLSTKIQPDRRGRCRHSSTGGRQHWRHRAPAPTESGKLLRGDCGPSFPGGHKTLSCHARTVASGLLQQSTGDRDHFS